MREGKHFNAEFRPAKGMRGADCWILRSECGYSLPAELETTFGVFVGINGDAMLKDRVKACAVADWLMENGWELSYGRDQLISQ